MTRNETPQQCAHRSMYELRDAIRRAGITHFRFWIDLDGQHMTCGTKPTEQTVDKSRDLPSELLIARDYTRLVYRVLRFLLTDRDSEKGVFPSEIKRWLDESNVGDDDNHSIHSINNALQDLRKKNLARSKSGQGWRLGCEQPSLPFPVEQAPGHAVEEISDYHSLMAGAGIRLFPGGLNVQRIWVPGEETEFGLVVTDVDTEKPFLVAERLGQMFIPSRSGRLTRTPAVKAVLLRTDGKIAVVRLPGNNTAITIRVLGAWQIKGLNAPEETELAT